jgi:hypothetical protein
MATNAASLREDMVAALAQAVQHPQAHAATVHIPYQVLLYLSAQLALTVPTTGT